MNNNLKNHYKNLITYDLLTKLNYSNIFQIPKITKIVLNIGFKKANLEKKKLVFILVILKLLTNQEPLLTKSKKNHIFFKIKKNSIIGCKITLRNFFINIFLEKLIFFILPYKNKIFLTQKKTYILNFQIKNIFQFFEFQKEFLKFKNIPVIDVSIQSNTKNLTEFFILLNSFFILKKESRK
jgi:ribosomal protein L5